MASFTTRVQLNGRPTADDYERLHKQMRGRGFSRFIDASDGKTYRLSHGEYNREGNVNRDTVREDAKAAAAAVSSDYEVFVSEATARTWYGLKLATQAELVAG
ncbi:MAG TPA: hypothetical protein VFG04_14015 [Planctomycetaceae bacterium]|jgi:hypothetical protein|nr:hypothetical protein [Planctomycetaceae bacterium]